MVFSSAVFLLLFLPAVYLINLLLSLTKKNGLSNLFLLLASLVFYAWGEPVYILLMLASIVINHTAGHFISVLKGPGRKAALAIGVVCDLGLLGYFKYAAFAASMMNAVLPVNIFEIPNISLPIGISFFTFQAISYIADVYRGDTEASPGIIDTALYISFFPQLIAGPIVKYRDIEKNIRERSLSAAGLANGFRRFVYGLAKKVLIANVLGLCADTVFSYQLEIIDPLTAWIGAVAYTLQIYYDFSGYSDMAIGLGRMFGFDIMENFNYPYLSGSISEFWRRWHISLGTWFREYVYIPLGGNRKGRKRTLINLIVVFFLTGLWHGADISFVLWGLYHGFFSLLERFGLKKFLDRHGIIGRIYCLLIVNFGWVLFRAEGLSYGIGYLMRMIMPWRYGGGSITPWDYLNLKTIFCGVCAVIGAGLLKKYVPEKIASRWRDSVPEAVFCVAVLILSLSSIAGDTYNPFIYFQF